MLQFGTDCKIVKIVLKVHHVSYNVYLLHYCKLYSNLFYSDDDTNIPSEINFIKKINYPLKVRYIVNISNKLDINY